MKLKILALVLSLLALHPSSSAQEIYEWRDEKGVWHYSDKPPKNLPLEEQQIKIKHRKWEDECPHKKDWGRVIKYYCHCVGRTVMDRHTKVEIGKIVGVAWRPKGALIGNSSSRVSPRDSFYYIVDDGKSNPFLKNPRTSWFFEEGSTLWCK